MNFNIDLNVIILILPVYIYLFISLTKKEKKNELTEELVKLLIEKHTTEAQKPIEKNVEKVKEDVKVLDKKIDTVESNLKVDISKLDLTIGAKIEQSIAESIQLRSYLNTVEKAEMDRQLIEDNARRLLDFPALEARIKDVIDSILKVYFDTNYIFNDKYVKMDGTRTLPPITEETKTNDLKNIHQEFLKVINKKLIYRDLGMIYDMTQDETEMFLVEKYIIPAYADKLYDLVENWQAHQERSQLDRADELDKKRKRAEENAAREAYKKSEVGILESAIDELINQ
jgi:hypothetical protein|nr:MAG TPA: Nuclear pore complex protein [Caudoviricetes sp.]